jgi:hypothetical protein
VAVAEELTRRQQEIVVLAIGLDKLDERSASSRSSTWLPSNWRPAEASQCRCQSNPQKSGRSASILFAQCSADESISSEWFGDGKKTPPQSENRDS